MRRATPSLIGNSASKSNKLQSFLVMGAWEVRQPNTSHDGSQCLGSSPINAGLRPLTAGLAEQRRPSYPPSAGGEHRGAHSGDSKNAAELSGLQAQVDLHLLHALIENAHAAAVPSHPHLPADILRRRFVKGSPHLHKAVPAYVAPGLLVAGKERGWQRLQMGGVPLQSVRLPVCRSCAVNARVGNVLFPLTEKEVLLGQGLEASPLKRVATNVGHPALHLPLVLRHSRTAGHHVDVVVAAKVPCMYRLTVRPLIPSSRAMRRWDQPFSCKLRIASW